MDVQGSISPLLHEDGEPCIRFKPDGKIRMVRQGHPRNNITIVNMIRPSPSPIPIDGIRCVGNALAYHLLSR